MSTIHAVLLTPVRLFGEALERCLGATAGVSRLKIISTLDEFRQMLADSAVNVVLLDVTQGIDFRNVSELAGEHPQVAFIALGLQEQANDIIRAGKSGFAGYVPRDASIAALIEAIADAMAGRLSCSGEIASELLRALFRQTQPQFWRTGPAAWTKRSKG